MARTEFSFSNIVYNGFLFMLILWVQGCTYDIAQPKTEASDSGYPPEIAQIFIGKCATAGCHNSVSKYAAGGLDMTSWQHLFEGTNSGVCIVPYRPDYSSLCSFINTYSDLGIINKPTMPLNETALSRSEVMSIQQWIMAGALNNKGQVAFPPLASRTKIYITNQGCDNVSVFDAETALQMRTIDVGADTKIEIPHMIKISPDGQYWYVVFSAGKYLQKFSTLNDQLVAQVKLSKPGGFENEQWNAITLSSDGQYAYISDLSSDGNIAVVNLASMQVQAYLNELVNPHGLAITKDNKTLYNTSQISNYITKFDISNLDRPLSKKICLVPGQTPQNVSSLNPHEIILSPDGTKYFVTCQSTNEVRIFNVAKDSLETIIPTGTLPQEMAFSLQKPYLFVTCTDDSTGVPSGTRGSVAVINYQTNRLVTTIYGFFQPHGLGVDDTRGVVYVSNRNVSASGPTPHHTSVCGGRNGFVQLIELASLQLKAHYRAEISVDPYSIAIKQ